MAKATITIQDEDGENIDVRISFDPALDNTSGAHHLASRVLRFIAAQDEDGKPEFSMGGKLVTGGEEPS